MFAWVISYHETIALSNDSNPAVQLKCGALCLVNIISYAKTTKVQLLGTDPLCT